MALGVRRARSDANPGRATDASLPERRLRTKKVMKMRGSFTRWRLLRFATWSGALILVAGLAACGGSQPSTQVSGSGVLLSEHRPVASFDSISIQAKAAELYIAIGAPTSVKVSSDDNIVPLITTTPAGNKLVVGLGSVVSTHLGIRVDVTVPSLVAVDAGAAVKVHLAGVTGEHLTLTGELGSQFTAGGQASQVSVTLARASRADLHNLQARDAVVSLNGSSTAEVFVTNSISGEAHGTSHLGVWGQSPSVTVRASEGSTITMMGQPDLS